MQTFILFILACSVEWQTDGAVKFWLWMIVVYRWCVPKPKNCDKCAHKARSERLSRPCWVRVGGTKLSKRSVQNIEKLVDEAVDLSKNVARDTKSTTCSVIDSLYDACLAIGVWLTSPFVWVILRFCDAIKSLAGFLSRVFGKNSWCGKRIRAGLAIPKGNRGPIGDLIFWVMFFLVWASLMVAAYFYG